MDKTLGLQWPCRTIFLLRRLALELAILVYIELRVEDFQIPFQYTLQSSCIALHSSMPEAREALGYYSYLPMALHCRVHIARHAQSHGKFVTHQYHRCQRERSVGLRRGKLCAPMGERMRRDCHRCNIRT